MEMRVFQTIHLAGTNGATSDQVAVVTGLPLQSVTPRFRPLERRGMIYRKTKTRKSLTSNRQRQVFVSAANAAKIPDEVAW
jgi:nucleoside recognition membrane protein YjiH